MGQLPSMLHTEIAAEISARPLSSTNTSVAMDSISKPFEDWKGYIEDLPSLMDAFVAEMHVGGGQNDRLLLLEKLITWMSNHPDSNLARKFEQTVVDILYKDLPHPPVGYVSLPTSTLNISKQKHEHITYCYRSVDGSNYNIMMPDLGRAGMPYARSVPSSHPLPSQFLPDPSLVFDVLLKRDKFVPHPGGVSSLFFAFADLIIHSIFNTDMKDPMINNSSSYLDLSPLYGSNEAQVDSVRRKDGSGRLYEDVFADSRLLNMPPSVCALLVLFNRNHNYIAEKILSINEKGHYRVLHQMDDETKLSQDEEIFQRARLVNCGFFMQIILADYVGAILGLVRDGSEWRLKVRDSIRRFDHTMAPRGEGNAVSVEFNLMYRWHATLSEHDTDWITEKFQALFPGQDLGKLMPSDLGKGYGRLSPPADTREWSFGGLRRDEKGKFGNDDLANILQNATEAPASAFKARGIPEALKVVELMGIQQARSWGTCSLNEFRKFMGLKAYRSFAEWNPDPEIHKSAEALYQDIENLELFVGMQAEESKIPTPGAGLCPGYTMSRAILSDAVCLTRGDRFMTVDFTPENFTAWGYQDCQIPHNDGSYGGMLTKLLFRHLPEWYSPGSAFAHFPFMVPSSMREAMERRHGPVDDYVWTRPVVQKPLLPAPGTRSLEQDVTDLHRIRLQNITGVEFQRNPVESIALDDDVADAFALITARCIEASIISKVGTGVKYVDVARDVINATTMEFITYLAGLRLNADYVDLADYVYVNAFPEQQCILHNKAKQIAKIAVVKITQTIQGLSDNMTGGYDIASPIGERSTNGDLGFSSILHTNSSATSRSPESLAVDFLGTIVATAPLFSRTMVRVMDHILQDEARAKKLFNAPPSIRSDGAILQYVGEAIEVVDDIGVRIGMMSNKFIEMAGIPMLKTIVTKCGLTRGPGRSGELRSLTDNAAAFPNAVYLNTRGEISPWPLSLTLQCDKLA